MYKHKKKPVINVQRSLISDGKKAKLFTPPVKDYTNMGIAQLKRLKNELDAKESIQRLNKIHNENIQRQINNNLSNEYTRIRNYLVSSMPVGTRDNHHLMKRMKDIENMKIV